MGTQQLVREATQEKYLFEVATSKVIPGIADHKGVITYFDLPVPRAERKKRMVWRYLKADRDAIREELGATDWSRLDSLSADAGAEIIIQEMFTTAEKFITRGNCKERKSTHPCVSERIIELVKQKSLAAGTKHAYAANDDFNVGIMTEYAKHIDKEKQRL